MRLHPTGTGMKHTLHHVLLGTVAVSIAYIIGYDMGYKQKLLRDWLTEWSNLFTQSVYDTVGKERPKKDEQST